MLEALGAIAGLAGKGLDAWIQHGNAKRNIKYQREFAQHGIRWKVADAQAAGLHPLAALGAQTHSFSPVSVGSDFGSAGQDISRAIQATQNKGERADGTTKQLQALQVQRAGLENQLLASQLSKMNQAGQPPPAPTMAHQIPGQNDAPPFSKHEPMEVVKVNPNKPGQEPDHVTDIGWAQNPQGYWNKLPSKEAKDRLEDMTIPQTQWSIRNQLTPEALEQGPYRAPHGFRWYTNPLTGNTWLAPISGSDRRGSFASPGIRRLQR